jgi:hypothetical protein
MGRSKKASRRTRFLLLLVICALALWRSWEQGEPADFVLTAVVVAWLLLILVAVWLPTTCDVVTASGRACDNDAYGLLRACHHGRHRQLKRRALLEILGFHRLARRPRRRWSSPAESRDDRPLPKTSAARRGASVGRPPNGPAAGSADPVRVELARSVLDRVVMVATIVGAIPAAVQVGALVL